MTLQTSLPFSVSSGMALTKKHWRIVMAKRELNNRGIKSSYLSNNQIHVAPIAGVRHGFVIQLEKTDLPGIAWSIDHFKIWSVSFSHTFVLLAAGNEELMRKLVHFSILHYNELN